MAPSLQGIVARCEEILERFDSWAPGTNWHTLIKQDFVQLAGCVRDLARILQHDGEELD